jgi:hypothetical protein
VKRFFNKITTLFNPEQTAPKLRQETAPLDLRINAMLSVSKTFSMLADGITDVKAPAQGQEVFAKGVIEMGEGHRLHRFYCSDEDFWIQVKTSGYEDNHVENIVLFNYLSMTTVHSEGELARLAGKDSPVGMPTYLHNGSTYQREWGTEDGQTELIMMNESVTNPSDSYEVSHLSMLYSRETDLSDRREFLLFSVEESGGQNGEGKSVGFSISVGITLFSTEITVI